MGIYTVLAIVMAYSAYRFSRCNDNKKKRYTWVKLLLTIYLLILVSFVTKKYYEVPVHYNSVKLENMVDSDSVTGWVHVTIKYDYNNSPDMRKSPNYKKDRCGLRLLYGLFFNSNHKKFFSQGYLDDSLKLDMRVKAENVLNELGVHDFNLDSVDHAIRSEIWTSNRQFLYPYILSRNEIEQTVIGDTLRGHRSFIGPDGIVKEESDTTVSNHRLYYRGFKTSGRQHNGCLREEFGLMENNNHHFRSNLINQRLDFNYPNAISTGEDISSAIEHFSISFSGIPDSVFQSITFNYQAPIDIDGLPFEPDKRTMTAIQFTDSVKLAYIYKYGLTFHVAFPDMKNTQTVRTFIATGIWGWLIGLLFTLLASLMKGTLATLNAARSWKEFLTIIFSLLKNLIVFPFEGFCSLFRKEKDGHRYLFNYLRRRPLVIIFWLLFIIAIILLLMIMNFSDVDPFGQMEGIDNTIFNLNENVIGLRY